MRSASSTASSTSCVTSSTVRGSRASASASQRCSCARVSASSAPNGSSRQSTGRPGEQRAQERDALAHPAATAPPAARASKPVEPERGEVLVRRGARLRARLRRPRAARAPRCRARSATAAGRRAAASARPAGSRSVPASGSSSPHTSSSSVDLPQPLGPTTATVSPRRRAQRDVRQRAHVAVRLRNPVERDSRLAALNVTRLQHGSLGLCAHRSLRGHYPTGSKGQRRDPRALSQPAVRPAPLLSGSSVPKRNPEGGLTAARSTEYSATARIRRPGQLPPPHQRAR